jgi:hypothetical protein
LKEVSDEESDAEVSDMSEKVQPKAKKGAVQKEVGSIRSEYKWYQRGLWRSVWIGTRFEEQEGC